MKKLPILVAVMYGTVATGVAQKSPSRPETILPDDSAPRAAEISSQPNSRRVTGAGMCRVHFDHEGRADNIVMTRSTGSTELDEDAIRSARHNWRGLPDSTASVPVKYNTVPLKNGSTIHYDTPVPAYPLWAERLQLQGKCVVQVLFDEHGSATFATVAKSSGSKALDNSTIRYVLAHWKSAGGEESVLTYPVTYVYQAPKPVSADRPSVPGLEVR